MNADVSSSSADGEPDAALAQRADAALASRLRSVIRLVAPATTTPSPGDTPGAEAAALLELIVEVLRQNPVDDEIWLLIAAMIGAYPDRSLVDRTRRKLQSQTCRAATISILTDTLPAIVDSDAILAELDVIVGSVIIDVDHSAKHDLHTGIQRVVRNVAPIWAGERDIIPAAWSPGEGCLRYLTSEEAARVLRWNKGEAPTAGEAEGTADGPPPLRLILPWRSVIVMAEVPPAGSLHRVAALADKSGNSVVGIAYDAIPLTSADMVPVGDAVRFIQYLAAVKFTSRMAGISVSAASEFEGFSAALATQGLRGPEVVEVSLCDPDPLSGRVGPEGLPEILVVGSHEPRKNHLGILHAAEILWREKLEFSLTFIGGSGWGTHFPDRVAELKACGRKISVHRSVSERQLAAAYQRATFTVFPSFHEGYGLPVAESLSYGVPCITSRFGSTAEIGHLGGAVLIDPREDDEIVAAMRSLLTDPKLLTKLRDEISLRPRRTWQDYSTELWDALIVPEQKRLGTFDV